MRLRGRDERQFLVVRQLAGLAAAVPDHDAVGLRTRHQLVHRARVEQDQVSRRAGAQHAVVDAHDRGRHRVTERRRVAVRMIEMQDAHRLAERVHHVVIAIGVERIAAIVARDRDRHAGAPQLLDQGHAAPARRAVGHSVLQVHVDGRQRDDADAGLRDQRDGARDLLSSCTARLQQWPQVTRPS